MFGENWQKASRRDSLAIMGYLGRNGDGKDLCMVHDVMPDMMLGLPILSTIPLFDWRRPCTACGDNIGEGRKCGCGLRLWPTYHNLVAFDSWDLLTAFTEGVVLISEIQGVASAKEHQGLPYQAANYLRKMRHYDVRLAWNAPDWMAADPVVRRVTKAVTQCKGSAGVPHALKCVECGQEHYGPRRWCKNKGRARLWPDNRRFRWRTYDKADFEVWDPTRTHAKAQKNRKLRPMVVQNYWRPSGVVQTVYNTFGEVLGLGTADQAGICTSCGGSRERKKCKCEVTEPVLKLVTLSEFKRWERQPDAYGALAPESGADQPADSPGGVAPTLTGDGAS